MRSSTALMAALLLLVVVSLAAADINIPYREMTEEEMRLIFVEWKAEVGRTYSSIDEEERHYMKFKDNLRKHNATGISLHSQLNSFSDLTHEEYSAIPCFIPADHDEHKGARIAYMLFGCGFIIYLWVFVQQRNP